MCGGGVFSLSSFRGTTLSAAARLARLRFPLGGPRPATGGGRVRGGRRAQPPPPPRRRRGPCPAPPVTAVPAPAGDCRAVAGSQAATGRGVWFHPPWAAFTRRAGEAGKVLNETYFCSWEGGCGAVHSWGVLGEHDTTPTPALPLPSAGRSGGAAPELLPAAGAQPPAAASRRDGWLPLCPKWEFIHVRHFPATHQGKQAGSSQPWNGHFLTPSCPH